MSSNLELRKLKNFESYRLSALITLLVQIFPNHPIHQHLKEKIQKSETSLGDELIESRILQELKTDLLKNLPDSPKAKIDGIWTQLQTIHSFKLHDLISQLQNIQKSQKPDYDAVISKHENALKT